MGNQSRTPSSIRSIAFSLGCGLVVVSSTLLMIPACLLISYKWEQSAVSKGMDKSTPIGNSIIVQIDAYKTLKGEYPEQLDDLVTAGLLSRIEPPTWGERKWEYSRSEDGTYHLSASWDKGRYPIMYYDGPDGFWSFDS